MPVAAGLTGIGPTITKIKKEQEKMIRAGNTAVREAARAALKSYYAGTPVWSGEAVRNYKVAIKNSYPGYSTPSGGRVNFESHTWHGDASLQNEARRGANQAASYAEANGRLKMTNNIKELVDVTVFNAIPRNKAALIEAGAAPSAARSRYSGGLTARATAAAQKALDAAKNPK
jgi:hypothetical protein